MTVAVVLQILSPIWAAKTETAKRVQGRIENIMDFAAAHQYRDPLNPARWRGHLVKLLPKPSRVKDVAHHGVLPYLDVPDFFEELSRNRSVSATALQFLILTPIPTLEFLHAEWGNRPACRRMDCSGLTDERPAGSIENGRK